MKSATTLLIHRVEVLKLNTCSGNHPLNQEETEPAATRLRETSLRARSFLNTHRRQHSFRHKVLCQNSAWKRRKGLAAKASKSRGVKEESRVSRARPESRKSSQSILDTFVVAFECSSETRGTALSVIRYVDVPGVVTVMFTSQPE